MASIAIYSILAAFAAPFLVIACVFLDEFIEVDFSGIEFMKSDFDTFDVHPTSD